MSSRPKPHSYLTSFDLAGGAKNPLSHGFFQWCVVTPDITATCKQLQQMYGVPGFLMIENGPLNDVDYRGKKIDIRIDMAFGYLGDTNVEVISPRGEGDYDLYREFLRERPEGGFHHLGFQVYDFKASTAQLEARFGPSVQSGRFGEGETRFAYYDTRLVTGIYTELICFDLPSLALMASLRAGNPPSAL